MEEKERHFLEAKLWIITGFLVILLSGSHAGKFVFLFAMLAI